MAIDPNNTRLKPWIRHASGSINQSKKLGVFRWRTEAARKTNMRSFINKVLRNYAGEQIVEVRFYDKDDGDRWVASWKPGDTDAYWH